MTAVRRFRLFWQLARAEMEVRNKKKNYTVLQLPLGRHGAGAVHPFTVRQSESGGLSTIATPGH